MSPLEPALRVVLVSALMVLVGVPATLATVVYPEFRKRAMSTATADRLTRGLLAGSVVAALATATLLDLPRAAAALSGVPDPASLVASTEIGLAWAASVLAGVVLLAGIVPLTGESSRLSRRAGAVATSAGALAMLLAFCWTRYSTAVDSAEVAVFVKFAHMSGAAFWVGGLLVMSALPVGLPDGAAAESRALAARLIQRFSMIAVVGVTLTTITGVLIASWHVRSVNDLLTTAYGVTLLAKIALVLVAATLGGFNRLVLHGQIHPDDSGGFGGFGRLPALFVVGLPMGTDPVTSFIRAVRVELLVLVGVLVVSVLLTAGFQPSYLVTETGRGIVHLKSFVSGFPDVLRLVAIAAAVAGSLVLGYEIGEFEAHRR